jgi:hypothetical protein
VTSSSTSCCRSTRRDGWIKIMKGAIARNASPVHSHRMMRRYAADAYSG